MRHEFRVSVGADSDGVGSVIAAFAQFAQAHEVPDAARRSVDVALDELLANVVAHGMAGLENGLLSVAGELNQGRLKLTLTDDGPGFDPFAEAEPDTSLSVEDRPIGGLGIQLVRKLMDEVSYERRDGQNVVVLVKNLAEAG
jgi:anti-sigma regulatory factor (Ser/Thr protein kinase)